MRVSGVLNNTYETRIKRNDNNSYGIKFFACKNFVNRKDTFTKSTPSFTAITTHGQLRYLTHNHRIRCIYCKKPMVYTGDISAMQRDGIFSGDVKTFVETVKVYKKHMKDVNRIIFNKVEKYSRKAPQTTLSTIIENIYSNSLKKLRKVQKKILRELEEVAKDLPKSTKDKFNAFMDIQYKRLNEEPYPEKFHGKTFKYKINKIAQSFGDKEDLKNYIIRVVSKFDNPIFKEDNIILPEDILDSISSRFKGKHITAKEAKLYVINRLQRIGERFGRKDLVELCKTSEKMVNGEPVKVNFSNKEFMHDLFEHVLAEHKKTDIYYRMIKIAQKLPNSMSNLDSFIVKWRYSNSDLIGSRLLEPSSATVEHVKPTSDGGLDIVQNWTLACKEDNNNRMSMPQYKFLKRFSPRNPQAFFNDIIEIANNEGTITRNEIEGMAQSVKEEGHVVINLNRLKCE